MSKTPATAETHLKKHPGGRPTKYTPELAEKICALIISGTSLRKICSSEDMPSQETVYTWLAQPKKREFSETFIRAREIQAGNLVDDCVDIADDSANDYGFKEGEDGDGAGAYPVLIKENVLRSQLRVKTRLEVAAKICPRKYGPKVAIGGDSDAPPVETNLTVKFVDGK